MNLDKPQKSSEIFKPVQILSSHCPKTSEKNKSPKSPIRNFERQNQQEIGRKKLNNENQNPNRRSYSQEDYYSSEQYAPEPNYSHSSERKSKNGFESGSNTHQTKTSEDFWEKNGRPVYS